MFRSRPFSDPTVSDEVSPHKQELPDLQTQLERGARFNQSLSRMKVYGNKPLIQPKIAVGAPGDKYEQEADRMAQQVMSMPAAVTHPPIQRLEMQEQEEKEPVQTKPLAASITPLVQREMAPAELEEEQEPVQMKRSLQETAEVSIQRDGTEALPAVPNYQLTPPSLLQPPDPSSRYGLGQNFQLHLDPQIQAMAFQHVQQQMEPATIRAALSQVNLGLTALPAPSASGPTATPTPNPFATPSPSPAAPLVPRGAGPDTPRPATAGDLMSALLAVPAIDTWIMSLKTRATEQMMRDWRRLSTGEQVGAVSSAVAIGAGVLAGILSDPNTREMALSQLNGRVLPVPGLNWLSLEINTGGNNLMLGGHVDIGSLLPPSLGFGPSSAQPIGGPPAPQPFVPGQPTVQREVTPEAEEEKVQMKPLANAMIQREAMPEAAEEVQTKPSLQRAAANGSNDASSNLESQLSSSKGGGSPLPDEVRSFMEPRIGADFGSVRVHTDSEAVQMNRELSAQAFTHGSDIYFGAGKYNPSSSDGKRLLAHELTHVVQQTGGVQPKLNVGFSGNSDHRVEVRESPAADIQREADDSWQDAKQRALTIKEALLDGWTEDEEKALNQIRGQSVLMLKEIRAQYAALTGGRSLESDFKEYCSSGQYKEALSLLNATLSLEDRLRTNIEKGWLFNTENEKGMLEVLRHASRPELDEAAKNPKVMQLLKNSLNDNEYYQARKLLTPNEMYDIVVERIKRAKGFLNDDESGSYNALLDLTPEQRRRLWQEHEELFSFMSEDEKESARKMCLGTEAEALKERMNVATSGLGTDNDAVKLVVEKTQSAAQQEQAIAQAIASGKTPDGKPLTPEQLAQLQSHHKELGGIQQNLLTAQYENGELKSDTFMEMLHDDVSAEEYQAFAGSMGVSQFQLAKQQILDAISTLSDDEESIYKAFDRLVGAIELPLGTEAAKLTPEQRSQAQKLANQKLRQQLLDDPDIKKALKANLNDEEMKEVYVHVSADTYQIALKNLEAAYSGLDTDEEGIFKIICGMSAADRKRMKEEQPRIYLQLMNPVGSLTKEEREMVTLAIDTGKIPTDKALNWAFGGWGDGTEEEMLEQTFAAMDEAERYEYRLGYFLFKGGQMPATNDEENQKQQQAKDKFQKLYQRMDAELGTDDLQKALDQLLGTPTLQELKSEQGRLMTAELMHHRIGEKGDIRENDSVSSAIMDTFSDTGEVSDQAEARFESAYKLAMADGKLTNEEFAALAALDKDFAQKYEEYVATVEQVASIASTVAAIAVGIVVTVATGGTAGPAAAGLLAQYGAAALVGGVAGATAKVGVSEAVGGSHYDSVSTEGFKDAVSGFADGAMAVLSAGLAARFASMVGLSKTALAAEMTAGILASSDAAITQAGKTFVSAGVRSAIEGFLSGAVGEMILTTADEKTWKQSIWGVIQSYGTAILKGGGIGAATGAITGGTLEALGTYVGVKRVQVLVQQLEAAGVSQQRLGTMSLKTVQALGQADKALAANTPEKIAEAAAVLNSLRGEMSPEELDNIWRTLGRHHTNAELPPLSQSTAPDAPHSTSTAGDTSPNTGDTPAKADDTAPKTDDTAPKLDVPKIPGSTQTLDEVIEKLRKLHPDHSFEPAGNMVEVNQQIKLHPNKLDEMAKSGDLQTLLTATKELSDQGGNSAALSKNSKEALAKLSSSGSHRLRFDYQLHGEVDTHLKKLGLEHEQLFQKMTDANRARFFDIVNAAKNYPKKAERLQLRELIDKQAASYAIAQKPGSVSDFVNHFEMYKAHIDRKVDEVLTRYADAFEKDAKAMGLTADRLTPAQKESLHKTVSQEFFGHPYTGDKQVDEAAMKQVVESAGTQDSPGKANDTIRADVEKAYQDKAGTLGGRLGSGQIDASLSPEEMTKQIQVLDEVKFDSESTAAYHAHKHYGELPPSHRVGTGEMDNYLKSLAGTIKTGQAQHSIDQEGKHVFNFRCTYVEAGETYGMMAIVKVTLEGKVVVATYFNPGK
jgi:hypothetical protein